MQAEKLMAKMVKMIDMKTACNKHKFHAKANQLKNIHTQINTNLMHA